MPVEVRQIWFELSEVLEAFELIGGVGFKSNDVLHGGPLLVKDEQGPDGPITFHTASGVLAVERPKIAAALITYCKKTRIPLPAAAKKAVGVEGVRLTLRTHYSGGGSKEPRADASKPTDPKPVAAPAWARQITKAEL